MGDDLHKSSLSSAAGRARRQFGRDELNTGRKAVVVGQLEQGGFKLELREDLDTLASASRADLHDIKADGLGERAALANGDLVTLLDSKSRRNVGSDILVPLFEAVILRDEVKVVTANDNGAPHLGRFDNTLDQTATHRNVAGERALLIHEGALHFFGGLEAHTDRLVPADNTALLTGGLAGDENTLLLLESTLGLKSAANDKTY